MKAPRMFFPAKGTAIKRSGSSGPRLRRTVGFLFASAALALAAAGCGSLTFETPPDTVSAVSPVEDATAMPTAVRSEVPVNDNYRLVGYFASWDVYARAVFLAQIHTERVTHINYAFSNISPEGECVLGDPEADTQIFFGAGTSVSETPDTVEGDRGNLHQLALLKMQNPNLRVLISIGGWTWSDRFSDAALTDLSRQKFVQSCLDLYLGKYGKSFDGVDIDWEYPVSGGLKPGRPEDKHNLTLLLQEFRRQMDALAQTTGRKYLLTVAGPVSPLTAANFELDEIQKAVDWINVMGYDFHVATEPVTGFLAPLYGSARDPDPDSKNVQNDDAAVRRYLAAGVPAKKIVLGIPFYGRAWQGTTGDGLFSPATGPAPAKYEPGYMDYVDLLDGPLQKYQRHWDADAKAPWLFDPTAGIFITYDDAESIGWKTKYIRENGLGGAMVWELGTDGGNLLAPLADSLFG